jgi:hypothetical protein
MPFADNKRRKRESLFFNKKLQRVTSVSAATEAIREKPCEGWKAGSRKQSADVFSFLGVHSYFFRCDLRVNILE